MPTGGLRKKVHFQVGDESCAAWYYAGRNSACVVMAGGLAVPKEPATERFARRFNDAGFAVLAFDYRRLGESGGTPRLVMSVRGAQADWRAAIAFARNLADVDPAKIAVWGFSASAGHLFPVASRDPKIAAVIAQSLLVDAPTAAAAVLRYSTLRAQCRLMGSVAMLSTPDALQGVAALGADSHPAWNQMVAARTILRLSFYRPGRHAARITAPRLPVVVIKDDQSTPPDRAMRAAKRAPRGEFVLLEGQHYAPFLDAHETAVQAEIAFLQRHLLEPTNGLQRSRRSNL